MIKSDQDSDSAVKYNFTRTIYIELNFTKYASNYSGMGLFLCKFILRQLKIQSTFGRAHRSGSDNIQVRPNQVITTKKNMARDTLNLSNREDNFSSGAIY